MTQRPNDDSRDQPPREPDGPPPEGGAEPPRYGPSASYGQSGYGAPGYGQGPTGTGDDRGEFGDPDGYAGASRPGRDAPGWGDTRPSGTPSVSIGDAYRFAWDGFKANPAIWIVGIVVIAVVGWIGDEIVASVRGPAESSVTDTLIPGWAGPTAWAVGVVFDIINWVLGAALVCAALRTTDGYHVRFGDLPRIPNLLHAILAAVIMSVLTSIGLILLIIPGLVVAVLGMFYLHVAIDERANAIDAIVGSFRIVVRGPGASLLLLLTAIGMAIVGALALLVGLLVTLPLVILASAYVYRGLTSGVINQPGSAGVLP
ncbi:hypothetical protein [Georgenia deserti]|uniref:DUF4013 domain-containing protein n=1 Tax=Georgenia deserti TaxID=2093781 RepID=A0ABW4L9J9_9MICO